MRQADGACCLSSWCTCPLWDLLPVTGGALGSELRAYCLGAARFGNRTAYLPLLLVEGEEEDDDDEEDDLDEEVIDDEEDEDDDLEGEEEEDGVDDEVRLSAIGINLQRRVGTFGSAFVP